MGYNLGVPIPPRWLVPLALGLLAPSLAAQVDRYELGLRLRDFERQLAATPDLGPETHSRRDGAFAQLDKAVQAFFALDTKTVAQSIDAAGTALLGRPLTPGEATARGLQLDCGPRLVPLGQAQLVLSLRRSYPIAETPPEDLVLRAWLDGAPGTVATLPLGELADANAVATMPLPIAKAPAGDHVLRWTVGRGDQVLVSRWQGVSIAKDLDARLAKLDATAETAERTLEALTLAAHKKTLGALRRKRSEETVLPGAHLLDQAEAIAAMPTDQRYFDASRTGQFWLRVPAGKGAETVRLFVPSPTAAGKRPIVVAMHGAGGSENLFFDGYGDGEVVRQCAQRGWFCVAPRAGLGGGADVPALLAELATRWPIDIEQVLVVGHSMGAAMAIGTVMRDPARYRAVAALGGGGNVRRGAKLDATKFFVGYGSRDFLRNSAQQLQSALDAAGAPLTHRVYEGVEHLAIVQIALPDVFAHFDAALAR